MLFDDLFDNTNQMQMRISVKIGQVRSKKRKQVETYWKGLAWME